MPPKSTKRANPALNEGFSDDNHAELGGSSSSLSNKKVRFDESGSNDEAEFDFEPGLETAKKRRGAVNTDGYGSDASSDESDGEGRWAKPVVEEEEEDMFAEEKKGDDTRRDSKRKKKQPKYITIDEIAGQEFKDPELGDDDVDSEGEPKLMAFNMKEDFEEGRFDDEGNFVRNKKDPNAYHDRWMEGMSKKDILAARAAHERRQQLDALKEAQKMTEAPQSDVDIRRALLEYLEPGETPVEALQRLGGGKSKKSVPVKRIPAWKAKKLAEKSNNMDVDQQEKVTKSTPQLSEEEIRTKEKIEHLTDLISKMMGLGCFYIYDDDYTYERILRDLRSEGAVPQDWAPGAAARQQGPQWEYRWTAYENSEGGNSEVYGPFSSEEMKAWGDQGYFAQGIMVRKAGREEPWRSGEGVDFLAG